MSSKTGKSSRSDPAAQQAVAVQAKLQQAVLLHQQGQLAQAQVLYEGILQANPKHFHALNLLGVLTAQTGQIQGATVLISQAIALKPDYAEAYCNLGNIFQGAGQAERAIAHYDKAIAINPGYADACYGRGVALKSLRQVQAAIASYDQAIAANPKHLGAIFNRANAFKELGQFDAAIAGYDAVLALAPNYASACINRGLACYGAGQFDAAIVSYDRAIALQPDDADAYYNRGVAYSALGRQDFALADYDRALLLKPDYAEIHVNRGVVLKALGRLDEAMASYDRALLLKPNDVDARWNRALLNLLRGNFSQGWADYESRWDRGTIFRDVFSQPLWLGKEPLAGKTILLHSEQGLGDTLQFCRYVRKVADMGAQVVLAVPQPLVALLKRLDGVAQVVAKGQPMPVFDYHCPLLSLPFAFQEELQTIPLADGYLTCDPEKLAHWQRKLGAKSTPRVGLVWSGSTTLKNDHNRSILLANLIKHLPVDFEYVSLQKEVRSADMQALRDYPHILRFENELRDFEDTAALCELMDVVISVDTSVAHLAGALARPVWVLLPLDPDWRWLLDRTDSPWYGSAKLYRQAQTGDWDSVFQRVAVDLMQALSPDA